jgi:hypothetical protein
MNKASLRMPALICLILLCLLLAGAIYWYRERMLFGDAAWIVFLVINKKGLLIQEHRYGSFITQLFPLAGTWLKLPLSGILLLYSASFNLFYLGVGLLLYRLRQYQWLILHTFYLTLIVSVNYFWTNNEVHQGIAWMFLFFGYVSYKNTSGHPAWLQYLLFTLLAFLAVFSHPLVILVSGFLWVYLLLSRQHPLSGTKQLLPASLILCGIVGAKYYISTLGWYDGGKIEQVTKASSHHIATALTTKTATDFMLASLTNYWCCTLFFIAGMVQLLLRRDWLSGLWVLLSVIAYAILICLINTGDPLKFHIESEWMGLSTLMCSAFVFRVLPAIRQNQAVLLLALVFTVRLCYIGSSAGAFTGRLQIVKNIVDDMRKQGQTRLILRRTEEHSALERSLYISWGLPAETLMYSTLEGDQPALTAAYIFEGDIAQKIPPSSEDFMTSFFTIPYRDMNRHYFRYDTLNPYQVADPGQWQ